jgi:ankyrin repeat protein
MRRLPPILLPTLIMAFAATVQAQDAQSQLWDAALTGDTALIRHAVTAGARLDSLDTRRSANGRLALNWAALNNRVPAIELLLEMGAELEAENRTGFTALHHAAEVGAFEAARALLHAGADARHTNRAGMTPAGTARENGFGPLADLLEAAARGDRPSRPH